MTHSKQPEIFAIGTASLDVLHLADGRSEQAAGGAGLYTALAAQKAGARAGLFAPKPNPMPAPLQPVDDRLVWIGPEIKPEHLPRLEIQHHGGGKATLLNATWGAETALTPDLLPATLSKAAIIHIAALSSARRQGAFLQAVLHAIHNQRPDRPQAPIMTMTSDLDSEAGQAWQPRLSVGTYAKLVYGETDRVRQLFAQADLFFMNENEAEGMFGQVAQAQTRPEALLFVTLDAEGVLVIEGQQVTHVPGCPVPEVDPTGAGDTFCGATLAGLAQGLSPVAAARQAVQLAAQTVSVVGPAALL